MPTVDHQSRRNKLVRKLRQTGADAILVTNETNVTYLTGFSGDSSYLLIGPNVAVLLSDARYTTQIADECPNLDAQIRSNQVTLINTFAKAAQKAKLSKVAIESQSMTLAEWEHLQTELAASPKSKSLQLISTEGVIEELREIKDAYEIAELRTAVIQAQKGYQFLKSSLLGSMTEEQAAHDIEHAMRRFGGQKAAFDPIVAVGPQSALPHARPGKSLISDSPFFLLDWGSVSANGYHSDLTRILVTGKILPKLEKIYRVVLKAQEKAINAIRPGILCREIDAIARKVIADAGYGKYFGHGLGHGIGLEIHEGPRVSPISKATLKPGMVITIEPGIYLPNWGGVRIEDDILVTRNGHELLTSLPKDFKTTICN